MIEFEKKSQLLHNQFITFWLLHGLESFFQIVQRLMPYTCNFHLALSVSKTHISPKIQNKKINAGIPFNSRVIQRINLKEYSNYYSNLAREKTLIFKMVLQTITRQENVSCRQTKLCLDYNFSEESLVF